MVKLNRRPESLVLLRAPRPCQDLRWVTPGGEKRDASQGQESPDTPRSTAIRAEVRGGQRRTRTTPEWTLTSHYLVLLGKKKMYTICHHWIVLVSNIFRELTDFSRNYLSLWPVSSISPIFKTPLDKHINDFFHLLGWLSTQWDSLIFPKFSLIEACFALLALLCLVLNYLLYKTAKLGTTDSVGFYRQLSIPEIPGPYPSGLRKAVSLSKTGIMASWKKWNRRCSLQNYKSTQFGRNASPMSLLHC